MQGGGYTPSPCASETFRVDPATIAHAQRDIRYHDIIASQYDRVVVEPRWASINALFRPMSRSLPADRRLMLDIGTGTGHMLRRFARLFGGVVAVDHSESMLDVTRATTRRLGLRTSISWPPMPTIFSRASSRTST